MAGTDRAQAGLTSAQAAKLLEQYGKNELTSGKKGKFLRKALHILGEPMFLLLFFAAVVYFILGEPKDGAVMFIFITGVVGIDVMQEWKTDRTLAALQKMTAPRVKALRDGREQVIPGEELVPGDVFFLCEGDRVPADAVILTCSDFCVDESMLTGESAGVWKTAKKDGPEGTAGDTCYAGTLVIQGNAALLTERTGITTEYGKIGLNAPSAADSGACEGLRRHSGSSVSAGRYFYLFQPFRPGRSRENDKEHPGRSYAGNGADTGRISGCPDRISLDGRLEAGKKTFIGPPSAVGGNAGGSVGSLL